MLKFVLLLIICVGMLTVFFYKIFFKNFKDGDSFNRENSFFGDDSKGDDSKGGGYIHR